MSRLLTTMAAVAAAFLVPAAASAQAYPPQPPIGTPKPFAVPASESFTLPNGMQVTFIPYGDTPKAYVSLRVYAGNLDEGDDTWLATLTAQLLREGAAGRSGSEIAETAAGMGSPLAMSSGQHETQLFMNVLSENAPEAIGLIADVMRRPEFPASQLERIRNNLLRTLAVAKSQPSTAADVALATAYYGPDHPYGRPFPSKAKLRSYSVADLQRFHAANFGAKRARLYVAGKFDAARVREAITAAYSDWQPGPDRLSLPPTVRPGPRVLLVDRPGAPQSTIRLAFPAPRAGAPEDIGFRVTDALLAGSFTSRITKNLREDKGYTYSPDSTVTRNPDEATWTLEADVTTNVTGAALKEVFAEIRKLQIEVPQDAEATGIRTWLSGIFILQNASPAGLVGSLAQRDFFGLPANWLDTYVPAVIATPNDDIRRLAEETLPLDRMTLVVVGDLKTVRPQLQKLPELRRIRAQVVKPF